MRYRSGVLSPLGKYTSNLQRNIKRLHRRMGTLNQIGLTHDEFLALFAPPEHWDILKTAREIAGVSTVTQHLGVFVQQAFGSAEIRFIVVGDDAPLPPRNHLILERSAPKELIERLTSWVNIEIEVGCEFARCMALMDWLDTNCVTKDQIRFLWPSIVALCSLDEDTADLGERLREFKPVRALPNLPAEVRAACKSTSGVIASAMLLDAEPSTFTAPVTLQFHSSDKATNEGALGIIEAL